MQPMIGLLTPFAMTSRAIKRSVVASALIFAGCDDVTDAPVFDMKITPSTAVVIGDRLTGENAGNVSCRYFAQAKAIGHLGVYANWVGSQSEFKYANGEINTLENTQSQVEKFWGLDALYTHSTASKEWGWSGPAQLVPVRVTEHFYYRVNGAVVTDSASYTWECR